MAALKAARLAEVLATRIADELGHITITSAYDGYFVSASAMKPGRRGVASRRRMDAAIDR